MSQNQNFTWIMGYHNGINDTNNICGKFALKFNGLEEPKAMCSYNDNVLSMYGNQATMCDNSGQVLFYFDGYRIADNNHNIIENGDDINSGQVREIYPFSYPLKRGCVILPDPLDARKWYIFHQYLEYFKDQPSANRIFCTNIFFSVVILDSLTNKFKVTIKNSPLLINLSKKFAKGHFNAIRHANGRDWWIITQELESDNFFLFQLTAEGILPAKRITVGLIPSNRDNNSTSVFSKDGTKFATCFSQDFIQVFDFDRCKGELYNSKRIYNEEIHSNGIGSVEISADNHFLYATTLNKIWQYDLWAANIQASGKLIGIWDSINYRSLSTEFYTMTRGIDDRIYISCFSGNVYLHRINSPNKSGDSCGFTLRAVTLPEFYTDLPQSINYSLGKIVGSICDSVSSINNEIYSDISVFPIPAKDYLIFRDINELVNSIITIYNLSGKLIISRVLTHDIIYDKLDISFIENGTYYYQISNNTSYFNGKFIVLR